MIVMKRERTKMLFPVSEIEKPYHPSDEIEGDWFTIEWCSKCTSYIGNDGKICEILLRTHMYRVDDKNYPCQWVIDRNGPQCTAFSAKDLT